ncbi:MAG: hypothetical protein LC772_02035, partial [Chloroflexi bacterium]|nr:hypothetical protein [Chloroflexota bacterium]
EMPPRWIREMTRAIRTRDPKTLITVGLLPWTPQLGFLSGFVPQKIEPEVDFVSVHIYPEAGKVRKRWTCCTASPSESRWSSRRRFR